MYSNQTTGKAVELEWNPAWQTGSDSHRNRSPTIHWLKLSAWEVRFFKETKSFFPAPSWPRGSVLGLRQPGFEVRVLCLGSVISSHSSHHHQPICAQRWSKTPFNYFHVLPFIYCGVWGNIALRPLHNHGYIATEGSPNLGLCPTRIEWLDGFFRVHSTIDRNAHSRHLNNLQHCIYTALMTNIRPGRDSKPVPVSFELQPDRMSHILWCKYLSNNTMFFKCWSNVSYDSWSLGQSLLVTMVTR